MTITITGRGEVITLVCPKCGSSNLLDEPLGGYKRYEMAADKWIAERESNVFYTVYRPNPTYHICCLSCDQYDQEYTPG